MRYRFIDADGREHVVDSAAAFLECVRTQSIKQDTLVFDPAQSRWHRAQELGAYAIAVEAVGAGSDGIKEEPGVRSRGEKASEQVPNGMSSAVGRGGASTTAPKESPSDRAHGAIGKLYYALCYIGAAVAGAAALFIPGVMIADGQDAGVGLFLFLFWGFVAGLSFAVGRGVQTFQPWARVVALGLGYLNVGGAFVSLLSGLTGPEMSVALLSGLLSVVFVMYFHTSTQLFTEGSTGREDRVETNHSQPGGTPEDRDVETMRRTLGENVKNRAYVKDGKWVCVCGHANNLDTAEGIQNCDACHKNRDFVLTNYGA